MIGITAKELKDSLKDVPDDYVVRLDDPTAAVGIPCGNDRVGPLIDIIHYQLDERASEVRGVSIDHEMKEVVIDAYIMLENVTYG